MSHAIAQNKGLFALIVVIALIVGLVGAVALADRAEAAGAAIPIPGTGCTLYAQADWDSQGSPPVATEGDVRCGSPPPTPTP